MMALEAVLKSVCDNSGAVEYERLLDISIPGTDREEFDTVVGNSDYFTVIQRNNAKHVVLRTSLKLCSPNECDKTCKDLHLCRFDLLGECRRRRCNYGHSLDTEHNSGVLRERNLNGLNKCQLRILLLQSDRSLLPHVCVSYNKGNSAYGNCPDKEACVRLHLCENYIRGTCDGSAECNRCHDFYEPHPVKTLMAKGVPSQLIGSLLLIYQNILALKDCSYARGETGAKRKVDTKFSNKGRVPESLQKKADNVICLSFVKGFCKYGDKCWRVHFDMPYKWEVKVDHMWMNLLDNEAIERDYCDPAKMHSEGTEPVCFDTMFQGLHRVRRLSTESSVLEPTFVLTTKWHWYWENVYRNWIQYASIKEMHRLSSITSDELEQKYLQFLKDDNNAVATFTTDKQFYELNFRDMKQRNEMSGTERMVRRRPQFLSSLDVQRARTRRGAQSSSYKGVPGFWDKTATPASGFQRVFLSPSDKDYARVHVHFHKTMKNFSILKIERVQNKKLWEDFQTKREQMKKVKKDKKYAEGERFLFHGTRSMLIDDICLQNFDMKVSGANGTVYGQGSYFAKDAKYSHDHTDNLDRRFMFMCRVLVGQYTRGASHYSCPPAKDSTGTLYDSCVNDVREPTIYVVFNKTQVYPEFLITYEENKYPQSVVNSFQHSVGTLAQSLAQSAVTDITPTSTPTALAVTSQTSDVSESQNQTAETKASPKTSLPGYTNQLENAKIQTASGSSCSSDVIQDSWKPVTLSSLDSDFSDLETNVLYSFITLSSPTNTNTVPFNHSLPSSSAMSRNVKNYLSGNTLHSDRTKIQIATLSSYASDITEPTTLNVLQDSQQSVHLSSSPEVSYLQKDILDEFTVEQRFSTQTKPAVFDQSPASSFLAKESSSPSAHKQSCSHCSFLDSSDIVRQSPPQTPQEKPKSDCTVQ
ncbi:protein mono-ADP-ribosyltransferase PARP12-like isoform X2 [Salminus brasiliensis]|uniref:protein mono-ADP-ribosyltransferase PARP12-like isoform X2 n=1 Tax=Salminus brasiliensis TaxID=930266 RepID=UPI003B8374AC